MDHQKGVRVAYRNGIQDFQSVGQSETQKLSSAQKENSAAKSIFESP
jgi:hypothetical protein